MLCVALYFFFFFFHEQLGGEKTTEKWLSWVRPKVSSTLLIWQIRCHFPPFIFLSLLRSSQEQCPASKHRSDFAVSISGCRLESPGRPWARLWELPLPMPTEVSASTRRTGGEARVLSSPAVVAPSPQGDVGRGAVTPHVKSGPNKQNSTSAEEILSRISGTSPFFFRLLDALTHMIFDGREWNICNWQRKTYRPIKKREFSCLPPFQS